MQTHFRNPKLASFTPPLWASVALLCIVVAIVWYPSLDASFQFDDWNVIVNNPRVHSLTAWWASMPGIRPLLKLSYALNYSISASPTGFRFTNVVIHALNGVLVMLLLRHKALQWGKSNQIASYAALLAALIFVLHPVQTEAVTYISGRSVSLCAFFELLSLYSWARVETATTSEQKKWWLVGCCVMLVLAVAVKETALVLPLIFWLWSATSSNQSQQGVRKFSVPLITTVAVLAVVLSLPRYRWLLHYSLDARSIGDNLLTQAHALFYLAGQLLRLGNMNIDPQLPTITSLDVTTVLLVFAWLALVAWSLLHLRWYLRAHRRRQTKAAFAALWFLIWLLPTNSVIPRLDVANDRQLYLALIGPMWCCSLLAIEHVRPLLIGTLSTIVLTLLTFATAQRNTHYTSEVTLWQITAAQNPTSSRAANNLAMAYAFACKPQAAAREFERASRFDPNDFQSRINLKLLKAGQLLDKPDHVCVDLPESQEAD